MKPSIRAYSIPSAVSKPELAKAAETGGADEVWRVRLGQTGTVTVTGVRHVS